MSEKINNTSQNDPLDRIMEGVEAAAEFANGKPHTVPNPGSDEAGKMGCKCPIIDNNRGRGEGPFWIAGDCAIHSHEEWVLPYV